MTWREGQPSGPEVDLRSAAGIRYYMLSGGHACGPYRLEELRRLPGFTLQTPLRISPSHDWKPAFSVIDIRAYFGSGPTPQQARDAILSATQEASKKKRSLIKQRLLYGLKVIWQTVLIMIIGIALIGGALFTRQQYQLHGVEWRRSAAPTVHWLVQQSVRTLWKIDKFFASAVTAPVPAHPPAR